MRDSSYAIRLTIVVFAVIALAGCAFEPPVPPGGRLWVITVVNKSPQLATFVVAQDGPVMGPAMGTATPNVVPPGTTRDVTFAVPAGEGWAIFVNPRPGQGPLLTPIDVPRATGIEIGPDGNAGWLSGG